MSTSALPDVQNNAAHHRYEVVIDGQRSLIQYQLRGDALVFLHTEVPPALEGRGIAGHMARFALEDARARNLGVVPLCPFVASYIRRHPEYQPLVRASGS